MATDLPFQSPRRVLITGINGFTGHYVAQRFQEAGWAVWGCGSQPAYGGPLAQISYCQADLADSEALDAAIARAAPQAVVHLAAIAFVGHGDADAFYRVNLVGTRHLLAALERSGTALDCVLLASSANVYGVARAGAIDEQTPAQPANDYAVSKLAMEHMARLFLPRLPIVIARPFNYTGVGQALSFLVPKIVDHVRRRAPVIELGNIDVARDFCDVRAVADAYLALVETAPIGETVNVCSGTAHSLRDVITMAEARAGHHLDIRINPAFVRANEIPLLMGNGEKLRQLLSGNGRFWSSPALSETIAWMLDT